MAYLSMRYSLFKRLLKSKTHVDLHQTEPVPGPAIPADNQAQTQGGLIYVPPHPELHPLAFGEFGVDGLEPLITQRS